MVHYSIVPLLSVLLLTSLTSAQSTAAECENISNAKVDPTCWETLEVRSYLTEWSKSSAQNCPGVEAWGDCFMRLTLGVPLADTNVSCTDDGNCPYPSALNNRGSLQGASRAKNWYAAYSIWFFHQYILRIHTLFENYKPQGGDQDPAHELSRFLQTKTPWSNNPAFYYLDEMIVKQIYDAMSNIVWTASSSTKIHTAIQTGLLDMLRDHLTVLEKSGPEFLDVATEGALLQNWSFGSIRKNETIQADVNVEEKMPGPQESLPGPTSAPLSSRPPASPRPRPRDRAPHWPTEEIPPLVPLVEEQPPETGKRGFTVGWTCFPIAPVIRPSPPYHLWHPTTVLFEYLHVRGYLDSGRFENNGNYPVVPKGLVHLCRWFNTTGLENTHRERSVWKDHRLRVEWLSWYRGEQERDRATRFQERDDLMMRFVRFMQQREESREREMREEAEREDEARTIAELEEEKREPDDSMDLDSSSGGSEEVYSKDEWTHVRDVHPLRSNPTLREPEVSQWQVRGSNGHGGEEKDHMENGDNPTGNRDHQTSNGDHRTSNGNHRASNGNHRRRNETHHVENGNQNGRTRLQRNTDGEDDGYATVTVNHEGEEDPDGLTQNDWDYVEVLEDALEIREGASMKEMVQEIVLWAADVHETGELTKRQQADEDKDNDPVDRRVGQVRRIRWAG
ncbi:MAG: hypothetical protein Q9169_000436 [Polycauliona sp. 2 TL-2023]